MTDDAKTSAKGFNYAEKIGKLIAMAEDERLDSEVRKTYANKAEKLMREYRITEEETLASDQFSLAPIWSEICLMEFGAERGRNRNMSQYYIDLFREVARHAGVRFETFRRWESEGDDAPAGIYAKFVGFEIDVRLAEFLWTSARLVFLTRIDPRKDSNLSDAENAYYMRASGMKRNEIATILWDANPKDGAAHGKVQKLYLAECARRGEDPRVAGRGVDVSKFREAYASSFVDNFGYRLRAARDAADKEGGAIELSGRKTKVDEAFYAEYPEYRPLTPEERAARLAERERIAAEREAEKANCVRCKALQAKYDDSTRQCRTHRPTTWTAAEEARWQRRMNGPEAQAGYAQGAEAARAVNIQRTGGERTARTEAANRKEIG
jgi:hypothetical protein